MKKPEKSVIEKAIIKAFGNLSLASKSLGVDRVTLYKWIEQEGLEQAVVEGRNTRLDFVESKLFGKHITKALWKVRHFIETPCRLLPQPLHYLFSTKFFLSFCFNKRDQIFERQIADILFCNSHLTAKIGAKKRKTVTPFGATASQPVII